MSMTHYPDGSPALLRAPHPVWNPPGAVENAEIVRLRALVRKLTIALIVVLIAGTFQWLANL